MRTGGVDELAEATLSWHQRSIRRWPQLQPAQRHGARQWRLDWRACLSSTFRQSCCRDTRYLIHHSPRASPDSERWVNLHSHMDCILRCSGAMIGTERELSPIGSSSSCSEALQSAKALQ